ncbi:hypothetical protein L6164_034713 [Bauhinia variegata]|uniref:Uncharacterized protein n=1 Tax=Bauhinia variegata TaxID=167791 RepID=A0ACB9KW13_BAUVA|nr:hypothetical protein L6164_034713 [Bauhinia variegata]
MKCITKFFFLWAMCLVFVPSQIGAEGEAKGKELIDKVCQGSGVKDLCLSILSSDPGSQEENENGLAMIVLSTANKNATDIIRHIKLLETNDSLAPMVQQGLADCRDTYQDAEDQLEDAVASLVEGNTKDAQKWLQAALAASDTCEDSLKGNENILLEKTEAFRQLCSMSLSIVKNLPAAAAASAPAEAN